MSRNFSIIEHPTRYKARCTWRAMQWAALGFWQGFAKPVLIVATGVALAAPLARMAGTAIGYMIWR